MTRLLDSPINTISADGGMPPAGLLCSAGRGTHGAFLAWQNTMITASGYWSQEVVTNQPPLLSLVKLTGQLPSLDLYGDLWLCMDLFWKGFVRPPYRHNWLLLQQNTWKCGSSNISPLLSVYGCNIMQLYTITSWWPCTYKVLSRGTSPSLCFLFTPLTCYAGLSSIDILTCSVNRALS